MLTLIGTVRASIAAVRHNFAMTLVIAAVILPLAHTSRGLCVLESDAISRLEITDANFKYVPRVEHQRR
ncbi:hypothetical protein BCAR13_440029 [Paraburkholderia caribensis]|nr:hypothetical protein BCAR13_440029 [Paraburkholderia caribensis]